MKADTRGFVIFTTVGCIAAGGVGYAVWQSTSPEAQKVSDKSSIPSTTTPSGTKPTSSSTDMPTPPTTVAPTLINDPLLPPNAFVPQGVPQATPTKLLRPQAQFPGNQDNKPSTLASGQHPGAEQQLPQQQQQRQPQQQEAPPAPRPTTNPRGGVLRDQPNLPNVAPLSPQLPSPSSPATIAPAPTENQPAAPSVQPGSQHLPGARGKQQRLLHLARTDPSAPSTRHAGWRPTPPSTTSRHR